MELIIIKMLYHLAETATVKVKFQTNVAVLYITNIYLSTVIFTPEKHVGVVGLRSVGYYKMKHVRLQQNLKYFIDLK